MEIDKLLNEETKVCPECAETIKFKAKKCRHCHAEFDHENVNSQVEARRAELLAKEREELLAKEREGKTQCPQCGNWDVYQTITKDYGTGDYCPHCKQALKSMGMVDEEVSKEQIIDKYLFRLILIAILFRDIIIILISIYSGDNENLRKGFVGLFWDSIFLSFLSIGKNWARILLKIKYIIGFFTFAIFYYSAKNYLLGSIDLALIVCIILLLFTKTYSKFPKYTFATFCVGLLALIFVQMHGGYEEYKEKNIISKIESPSEYTSKLDYVIKLPSKDWKFIPKDDAVKMLGITPDDIGVTVATKSASVFGMFVSEDITELNIEGDELLKKISEYMKKDVLSEFDIIGEKDIKDGKLWLATAAVGDTKYTYAFAWRAYNTIALNTTFWTIKKDKEYLTYCTQQFLDNISEVPLKKRLVSIKSSDIFSKNNEAVVLIRSYDKSGNLLGFGSGFNVHKNGVIVTNLHVIVSGGIYLEVKFPKHGNYEDVYIAGSSDVSSDLAILKIDGKDLPVTNITPSVPVEVGDKIYTISNPEGFINTLSEGLVSGIRKVDNKTFYQITASISEGSSGGAVFNEFGEVIGIATMTMKKGQNLNFIISIEELSKIKEFEEYFTLKELMDIIKSAKK